MPIYNTNQFWNYVVNEPKPIIDRIATLLTKQDYNFEEKSYETSTYYTLFPWIDGSCVLRFPAGLTSFISKKISLEIEHAPLGYEEFTERDVIGECNNIAKINPCFEVRDYQVEATLASLNQFSSLIHSGVGSGKTSIMSIVCRILKNDKILIMNGNNFILQQIYDRLLSFDITDVSWTPSKEPDYSKRIVLINSSSSDSRLNKQCPAYLNFLQTVNTWITDEAHKIQALTSFEPIFYMDHTKLRHIIGYTGSPFRNPDHPYNNSQDFRTIAILGEPAFTYEMKDTIADGTIAQPYCYFIRYPNKPPYIKEEFEKSYYMQYRMGITYNKPRIKAGLEMLKFLDKNGIKTLASFNNIKPGQNLMKQLTEEGIKCLFICGNSTIYEWVKNKRGTLKLEERDGNTDDVKKALRNGYNIVFGTTVMDEGVDIDIFQAAVMFSAGKTPIAGIQRIGRASRKRKVGQNISFIIDFRDTGGHSTFNDHYLQRKKMMEKSGVKMLEQVQDFIKMIEEIKNENTE